MASTSTGPAHGVQPARRDMVVAIDYGTHGTGFAFSIDGGRTTRLHDTYPDLSPRYPKTRTAILYNGRSVVAIGDAAIKAHSRIPPSELASHTLLKCFKLAIHNTSMGEPLPAWLNPVQVAADFLGEFRKYVVEQLTREELPHGQDQITWCLTVPAMWSEAAKQKMRQAALRAGMIRSLEDDRLMIILEPEAAALKVIESKCTEMNCGDTYMVLDAGGGTTDITVHTVESRGGELVLAEATHAMGEMIGATIIDCGFMDIYRREVGEEAYDSWKEHHPDEFQLVSERFEAAKRLFTGVRTGGEEDGWDIPVPPRLHASLSDDERAALLCENGSSDNVKLTHSNMMSLFDPLIDAIIKLAKEQLKTVSGPNSPAVVSKVILVGGLADSCYFRSRVTQALSADAASPSAVEAAREVVVPPQPYAAVLAGAVMYGCRPELISARRSRMSYGIKACAPYMEGAPEKFWHEEEAQFYCGCVFSTFVARNQLVKANEVVEHFYIPLYGTQGKVSIDLYGTDNVDARYVQDSDSDMRLLGQIEVDLPPNTSDDDSRVICVSMLFGRTQLTVRATEESTGHQCEIKKKFASM